MGSQTGEVALPKGGRRELKPHRPALVVVAVSGGVRDREPREREASLLVRVSGHVHLVWLMLVCGVLGGLAETLIRRVVHMHVRAQRFGRLRRHEP